MLVINGGLLLFKVRKIRNPNFRLSFGRSVSFRGGPPGADPTPCRAIPRLLGAVAVHRDVLDIIARAHRSPARQDGPLRASCALAG